MDALIRNWWMLTLRGVLGVIFGVVAMRGRATLGEFALLFGVYVFLDGVLSIASGLRTGDDVTRGWPLILDGTVSVALGALIWWAPGVPRGLIYFIALWALVTGGLEIALAAMLPRASAGRWLTSLAGISSVVVGLLLVGLPLAGSAEIRTWLGIYALLFGWAVLAASLAVRRLNPTAGSAEDPVATPP